MRDRDEPIPAEERLYRSVATGNVDGDAVLPGGVEMPATSFNRGKYSAPRDVLQRADEPIVAWMAAGDLPPAVVRDAGKPYEFFCADDPLEDNEAHSEVRIRPTGEEYTERRPKDSVRKLAKAALAERLRIYCEP